MAYADYYLCDGCECKTFYDSNLMYGGYEQDSTKMNGNPVNQRPWPDGNIGYMFVVCPNCAKKLSGELGRLQGKADLIAHHQTIRNNGGE